MKHIDIKEFVDSGFLQEANRLFFHPHGLALELTWDDDPHDRDTPAVLRVQDHRADPEGVVFGWENLTEARLLEIRQKAALVKGREWLHYVARQRLFGGESPLSSPHPNNIQELP